MRKFWILVFLILFLSGAVLLYINKGIKDSYIKVLTFKKQGIEISLYSKSGSIKTGGNSIKVVVVPPKEIKEFYFYMPPMPGMNEMRDVAKLKKVSEGTYEGNLNISMDGPWQIRVVFEDESMITHDVFVPIVKGREEKPPVISHGGHLMISPEKLQLIGIITEPISKRELVKTFSTVGYVEYNREKIYDITVRADAWIEKTYGRFEGEYVRKGTPLMKILSPKIQVAIEELKQAEKLGDKELIEKTKRKLNYYKTGKIIRSPVDGVIIEKKVFEGGFVKEGFTAYRIADISEAWIIAEVPLKLANYVKKGTTALVAPEDNPEMIAEAEVDYIFPEVDKFSKTVKVRLKVKNPELTWKPFSLTEVIFEIPLGEVLAVPESAVIDTGKRTIVFVEMEKGMYMPVNVKLGRKAEGYYEVIHGLKEGDKVVVKGTFLLDAEAQIRGLYGEGGAVHHHH
ncbi:MAG TPA: efflux RND transporter periplasmic adaptor subunit [Aquificaceae bacterium]|nr:efflux RND transporter periplasmic adaptor subunit [Aquificaceae bacterium]